jgi:hypothetical protein
METRLTHGGHTRRFLIEHTSSDGWEVREELDDNVLSRAWYGDWHRVEQAVSVKVCLLEQAGWSLLASHRVSTNR